jgi:CMP-N,N'-diacetyllegionaminic acid synthase
MSPAKPYVVALVPARSGSKGIKSKNLRTLHEKSLLDWSIQAGKETQGISRVVVSTNSNEYAEIAKKAGAEVPFLRPESISQDKSTDFEFVSHALSYFNNEGQIPDLIVHLRPTTPFRNPKIMDQVISDGLKRIAGVTSMRSVHEMSESAYKSFEIGESGNLVSAFSMTNELDSANVGRQSFPKTYSPNGYIDLLYPDLILNSGLLHGNNVSPIITENTIEIDSEHELSLAQAIVSMNPEIFTRVFGDK